MESSSNGYLGLINMTSLVADELTLTNLTATTGTITTLNEREVKGHLCPPAKSSQNLSQILWKVFSLEFEASVFKIVSKFMLKI